MATSNTGDYNTPFLWLQCQTTLDTQTGNKPRTFLRNGYLWGNADYDSSDEVDEFGGIRLMVRGTVRFRQWVKLDSRDRVRDCQFNREFLVKGVRYDRANNETLVDVESYDGYNFAGEFDREFSCAFNREGN